MTKLEIVSFFRSWQASLLTIDLIPEPAKSIAVLMLAMTADIIEQSDDPIVTIERIRKAAPWLSATEREWSDRIDEAFGEKRGGG